MKFGKLVLAIASCGLFAMSVYATHSWSDYHWARTSNPMDLPAVSKITPDWNAEYEVSLDAWATSTVIDHTSRTSGSTDNKDRRRCNAETGKMVTCNATYGNNGWAGLASINIDSNRHITLGTAKMNDTYLANDTYEYRLHVMCQEIGHVYGLGHTSEDGSSQNTCMDYSNSDTSTLPNAHDYDLLEAIYSHLDSYSTVAGGGTTEPPKPCRGGKKKCGNGSKAVPAPRIKVKSNGKSQIWVSPGDNDTIWVHHITLAKGFTDVHFGDDHH